MFSYQNNPEMGNKFPTIAKNDQKLELHCSAALYRSYMFNLPVYIIVARAKNIYAIFV
jgi:hypothetical protein